MPGRNRAGIMTDSGLDGNEFGQDRLNDGWKVRGFGQGGGDGRKRGEGGRGEPDAEIGFIEDQKEAFGRMGMDEMGFRFGQCLGGVDDTKTKVGLGKGMAGSTDAFLFDFAWGIAKAGRIDEADGISVEIDIDFDGVAGCSRVGGDDGAIAAGEEIEEGGFADVRGAGDNDAGAIAQEAAFLPGIEQGLDGGGNGGDPGGDFGCNNLRQFVIREIQHGFDVGGDGEPILIDGTDLASEGIFEEGGGHAGGAFGAGMDEVEDGFGLGEVELAEEEGALGEFAGFGLPGAGAEEGVEDAVGGLRATVAVDFDGIFAGIGMGGAEKKHEGVIEGFVGLGIDDLAVGKGAGGALGGEGGGAGVCPYPPPLPYPIR